MDPSTWFLEKVINQLQSFSCLLVAMSTLFKATSMTKVCFQTVIGTFLLTFIVRMDQLVSLLYEDQSFATCHCTHSWAPAPVCQAVRLHVWLSWLHTLLNTYCISSFYRLGLFSQNEVLVATVHLINTCSKTPKRWWKSSKFLTILPWLPCMFISGSVWPEFSLICVQASFHEQNNAKAELDSRYLT